VTTRIEPIRPSPDRDAEQNRDAEASPERAFLFGVVDPVHRPGDCAHRPGNLPDRQRDAEHDQPDSCVREDPFGCVVNRVPGRRRKPAVDARRDLPNPDVSLPQCAEDAEREHGERDERDEYLKCDRTRPGEQVVLREQADPEVDEDPNCMPATLSCPSHGESLPRPAPPESQTNARVWRDVWRKGPPVH
jgi:hypothetical protein